MRFVVEAPHREGGLPVWDDSDALVHLDRLIARADEAAHEVVLRDADLLDESEWFRGARPKARDRLLELCELARASAWTTPSAQSASWPVTTLAEAERALRMANSPVKILVEDRLRDGALLEVAVRLLAGETLRLLWIEPPAPVAIDVLHAGGTGNMPGFIEREAEQARQADLPLRLIVIVDSDRSGPQQPPSEQATRIEQVALQKKARPFILTKREGENYIPDAHWRAELQRNPNNPNWTQKMTDIMAMSADDRDYCDMEKLGCKQLTPHYDQNCPYHLEILLQRVREPHDPASLGAIAEGLRARDHSDDLVAILKLIEQER
ncbi:MAG: hypothetical protein P9F75_15420 [Candidatus Contendobacter sp.]|nr:hypothetical protein [Candidatus Contendobacter sp.]